MLAALYLPRLASGSGARDDCMTNTAPERLAAIPMGGILGISTYTPIGYAPFNQEMYVRDETQQKADARLARIEGQIRAVRKMVAEDRYCIDVVRQVQAARSALSGLETLIIDDHVDTCVQHALEAGETGERREKVTELVSILTGKRK